MEWTLKRVWSGAELREHWVLSDEEIQLLKGRSAVGRVLFAYMLKHYQLYARFPSSLSSVSTEVIDFLAAQVSANFERLDNEQALKRSMRDYAQEVRAHLKLRRFDQTGKQDFKNWLLSELLPQALEPHRVTAEVKAWFSTQRYELPKAKALKRLLGEAERIFEIELFESIVGALTDSACTALNDLLDTTPRPSKFSRLRSGPGKPSLESILTIIDRLQLIRQIGLPSGFLDKFPTALVARYRQRAGSEDVWELRRHPEMTRLALLAIYSAKRETELIDDLVETLIGITHKIAVRAEKRVVSELVGELTKVNGKTTLLFRIAEAANAEPEGSVRQVIYPVVGEQTIADLVKEYRSDGPAYVKRIYRKIRTSYAQHYRRMMMPLLSTLEFRSTNLWCQPLLEALSLLRCPHDAASRYFPIEKVAVDDVIQPKWRECVIESSARGQERVNRINYEICVLHELRAKLRTKEIWVENAGRFCDPAKDLPQDFEAKREEYCQQLDLPSSAEEFVRTLSGQMQTALTEFDQGLAGNSSVRIKMLGDKARISVSPLKAQPEPPNLQALRDELVKRWPVTSLLDALKETDLRVGFSQHFSSTASRQHLKGEELSRRLLLVLYGLGTSMGLKALAAGKNGVSYKELLYLRRRYIHADNLRQATRLIANATMQIRQREIWGDGSTSCASDSTQFGAWDQNLMTEWHQRYNGRGVMIYWHVDTNATCIHSQLKRCSSSEVASMMEGVLHHCTEMEVDRQYVDTHGQSLIAFAFCTLLDFDLMPRFKGIARQKLVRARPKSEQSYRHIDPLFANRPIDWDLIKQQYHEMIRLASALYTRTADPEAILRRFSRGASTHPTYMALLELGRAAKTIFLCRYLNSEQLRQEIHSGLNVVERWNGVNNFICFGKAGEFTSNRLEDQETSALCLHLLQSSMVYINTLMIQDVLSDPVWAARMTERDWAGLSPLPHSHYNPYGEFPLDMEARLPLHDLELAA
ncbi:Tn3 family transposase [Pseudovibrio sp. Ad46]|uniref:Tn3 family transposase n=1 Tax=Pseudovibrio sp. Ad46 TaxID=989432 RepID=UPI0009FE5F6A|nr:Tn3 family transposase [Pseudovibrio sp. Ad46]